MDLPVVLIVVCAFGSVSAIAFVGSRLFLDRLQLRRRTPSVAVAGPVPVVERRATPRLVNAAFAGNPFGLEIQSRHKLRRELIRAGFFGSHAVQYYIFARACSITILPIGVAALVHIFFSKAPFISAALMLSGGALAGVFAPQLYLSRRKDRLTREFRLIFPDLMDLLIVCITSGLSLEASFDRVRGHLGKRSPAFGRHLELMGNEMRAGRSTIEALNSLADRLVLDEANSFLGVLKQSLELGGDVVATLRVFSDEMREARMLRAEEMANKLSVKIMIPLIVGIFPVIFVIVLLPVILSMQTVFH